MELHKRLMQNYIVFGSIVINILPDFVNNLVSFVLFIFTELNEILNVFWDCFFHEGYMPFPPQEWSK